MEIHQHFDYTHEYQLVHTREHVRTKLWLKFLKLKLCQNSHMEALWERGELLHQGRCQNKTLVEISQAKIVSKNWCHFAYSRFAYSHFAYLLPLSAISPTHAKCDQNNVKQLKLQSLLHFGVIVLISSARYDFILFGSHVRYL